MISPHTPVLASECVNLYNGIGDGVFVDCTLGYGGHAKLILDRYPNIEYIGIDRDITAIEFSTKLLYPCKDRFQAIHGSFSEVFATLKEKNIVGVLADLGISSLQVDRLDRGFGFASDELDMRMDRGQDLDAKTVVNSYSQLDLMRIIKEYGEDTNAKKIADLIVKHRPFNSAKDLSDLIERNLPRGKIHPATKLFQAIRIEVNKELDEIQTLLDLIATNHRKDLIVGIISFHSLEDRIVKQAFKQWSERCICPPHFYRCECGGDRALGVRLTKKPVVASADEIRLNPRSRSAKLRGFRFGK